MRVLMNGVSALKPKTGVGHTTAYLHRALTELRPDDRFWLYPGDTAAALVRRGLRTKNLTPRSPLSFSPPRFGEGPGEGLPSKRPNPPTPFPKREGGAKPSRWKSHLAELAKAAYRVHIGVAARWGKFDLYHEPNFVPVRTHLPTVVTVHDLSVLLFPQWHPADRVKYHETHFRRGVESAEHVVVVSESVRQEVISVLGIAPHRVTAVHNGIGDQFRPQSPEAVVATRRKLGLPPRYQVYVGTIEPRKNVRTLLRAFCDLPAELRERCPLVLAGGWGWKSEPERELFESEAKHLGAIHLGYVEDADLPGILAGADALLYPSYYEGFGLPPVEMLACGGAVVASTADALKEMVGGFAPLLAPADLEGWRDVMRRVALREEPPRDVGKGMAHAGRFTWTAAAAKTVAVYERVLGIAAPANTETRRAAA